MPALWTVLLRLKPLDDAGYVEGVPAGGARQVVAWGQKLQAGGALDSHFGSEEEEGLKLGLCATLLAPSSIDAKTGRSDCPQCPHAAT